MYKLFALIIIALTTLSCQKRLAYFQAGKTENYHSPAIPKISNSDQGSYEKSNLNQANVTANAEEITGLELTFQVVSPFQKEQNELIADFQRNYKTSDNDEVFHLKKTIEEKKTTQNSLKRKKLYPAFNDNLKIGLVFLIIAGILAVLNLTQLVLIFGLASLIFLYLGLKKYYRRKRIKSIFRK